MADAQSEYIQAENTRNERNERVALNNQVQMGQARVLIQAQPNGLTSNSSGYWKGTGYKSFFTFGESKLGGSDVLK